ncbi:cobalamin biosynthetic protein CobC [Agrobacterium vitis]|nr:cobalamin biosynthetic protein CobC [Agrobacterium vitis]MBE1438775.1 cobalamin biosynthetic protein CobC [Agrobacterium vitis]
MTLGPIAHGGGLAAAAARFGGQVQDWLDLSTGINPCPPALPPVEPRLWHRLPDREREDDARLAARDFYGSGAVLPLLVPGTQSAIQLLPRLIESGKRAAILSPTYGEYARSLALAGLPVDCLRDLADIGAEHGLVVVVNPNNPTGQCFAPDVLQGVAARMQSWGGVLVVDEAFGDCQPELSLASRLEQHDNLVIFRSFGKFFGMAGVRLGFVMANNAILNQFADGLGPWAVSGPALALASALLRGDSVSIRQQIAARKTALDGVLQKAGLTLRGGTPLFSLVEIEDAQALHEHLCRDHILTRIFDYAPSWIRIGLTADQGGDQRLARSLQSFLHIER